MSSLGKSPNFLQTIIMWIQLLAIIFFFGYSIHIDRKIQKWKLRRALNFLEDIEHEENNTEN